MFHYEIQESGERIFDRSWCADTVEKAIEHLLDVLRHDYGVFPHRIDIIDVHDDDPNIMIYHYPNYNPLRVVIYLDSNACE